MERRVSNRVASSVPALAIRCYVLGRGFLRLFSTGPKQSTRFGGPAQRKTSKQNPKNDALCCCG